ncbi:hypothetical protein RHMOL_Rhmol01G0012300 [Rhododendron molle]|uniref:Uncharacterized protein n=1 Tax=Rhododendron molle TaxID=49168 RepID=A0ACC0PYA8_RHOML|nr:hypothetical protein RHMOL_Rhmol01G0012300 [Rhododendron molle]
MQSTTAAAYHNRRRRHHHDTFNPNPNSEPNSSDPPEPNPRLLSLLLKSIIMILITSLFFIFLSIASLVVLHFFLAGGHALGRRHRRRSATLSDLQRSLPTVRYDAGADGGEEDCAVCLDFFKGGERCRVLPDCGHVFHAGCVDTWLVRRDNCPVCRARVRLDLGPTGSAMGDDDCKIGDVVSPCYAPSKVMKAHSCHWFNSCHGLTGKTSPLTGEYLASFTLLPIGGGDKQAK